ncbi:hypothetical protein DSO57_1010921 [Entomophthora muscae]|uniref:Uncharacterized protein n=1 Tax=Entomophthora muscae TaxID=34485 RepID=A0ACC2U5W4_9FUNG|nr:hypothetical protein DSO57_1010921 [Entomophthora muscae]
MTVFDNETLSSVLKYLGLIFIGTKVLPLLRTLYDVYLVEGLKLKKLGAGKGAWIIITGCTDGIGKEFALQLAKAKFNILLISRTQSKLDELKEIIVRDHGIEAKTLAIDFCKPGTEKYDQIKEAIQDLDVHALINNVGLSHEHPKSLEEEDDKAVQDILEINVTSTVLVTKAVIPAMIRATSKSGLSGLIMTVGSFSGVLPTPYLTTYSASKAFLQTFTQSLGPELEKHKIVVTNIIPYFVVSKMSKIRKSSFLIPSPQAYVRSVLSKIGVTCGTSLPYNSIPYSGHAIIGWALETFGTQQFWINFNRDGMLKTRARALKKKELAEANATAESKSQ